MGNLLKTGVLMVNTVTTNTNLFLNADFHARYNQTTGWDTAKNGTLLATNWGGYNGGVTNASTAYHAHLKLVNGEYVYEYIRENETWLGISQGGIQQRITSGQIYTFSWEQYCVSGANYVNTGLYYYKTGATSANFHLGTVSGNTNRTLGEWQKFKYTFTAPNDGDYSKNMSWYIYGHSGGQGTMYMRHPKLELGSSITPFSLHINEGAEVLSHGFEESNNLNQLQMNENYVTANEFIEL